MIFDERYATVFNNSSTSDYEEAYTPFLYNTLGFIGLKEGYEPVYCELLDHQKKKVVIRVVFLCKHGVAVSLPEAPFGGIHFDEVTINVLRGFIIKLINYFETRNFKQIVIKNPADVYNSRQNSILANCLFNAGFVLGKYDINHHIKVDRLAFSAKIHKMENRKLKAAIKNNFCFKEIVGTEIETVYNYISSCRDEKNIKVNITFEQLNNTAKRFPAHYKFFIVRLKEEIAAATVAVFVNQDILYNYLPASAIAYNKYSPMVFLLNGLYEYCQSKSVGILDLGISTVNNKPQESLIVFKEHMAGEATLKLTFTRDCSKP